MVVRFEPAKDNKGGRTSQDPQDNTGPLLGFLRRLRDANRAGSPEPISYFFFPLLLYIIPPALEKESAGVTERESEEEKKIRRNKWDKDCRK